MSQKNKTWILSVALSALLFLLVYWAIHPDDSGINSKFFRDNPDFVYKKEGKSLIICREEDYTPEIEHLLHHPDEPFIIKKRWIKDEQSRSILTWRVGSKKVVIKRYNPCNVFHWIHQIFSRSSSKALRAFYYSYLFDKMDINSARAIAIVEKRLGPFHGTSYQVLEHIKGMKGSEFFDDSKIPEINYEKSIKETIDIAKKLENANLVHGELKLGHLFYVEGVPYLIDLDSVRRYKSKNIFFRRQQRKKDLNVLVGDFDDKLESEHRKYFTDYYKEQIDPNIEIVKPNF